MFLNRSSAMENLLPEHNVQGTFAWHVLGTMFREPLLGMCLAQCSGNLCLACAWHNVQGTFAWHVLGTMFREPLLGMCLAQCSGNLCLACAWHIGGWFDVLLMAGKHFVCEIRSDTLS